MSLRTLSLLASGLLLVALIAMMPLAFLHGMAGQPLGAQASVYGRVWDGRLYNVAAGSARFSQVNAALRPASLITGRAGFDWQIVDPNARGSGQGFVGFTGFGLREAQLTSRFRSLGLPVPAAMMDESLSLDLAELAFDDTGCVAADAVIRTSALMGLAARYDVAAPMLEGALSCRDRVLFADLSGQSADMEIVLTLSLSSSGLYRWTAEAQILDASLTPVFSALGFTQDGAIWRQRGEGQL
ncbi:type II secretion system protein N [Hyphobacterium sp.]|uniref:type II secretion system protein N n=1 Tax=Hyphobacterium sp. TaxID=2004662 RepID=UPI00374786FC